MDERVKQRLQQYAFTPMPSPDFAAYQRGAARRRWRRAGSLVAVAAVLTLLAGGVAGIVLGDRGDLSQPITPVPPSPVAPPSAPTAPATPTDTATAVQFDVQPGDLNGQPTAGVGGTLDPLRLQAISFDVSDCPDGAPCPIGATLDFTNPTASPADLDIVLAVFDDGQLVTTGTGRVRLDPGKAAATTITLDPATTAAAPQGPPGNYTWNWSLAPGPSPQPTPTGFDVNPDSAANPPPVGGIGDVIQGLRLDKAKITPGQCSAGPCPRTFTFTVTNTTDTPGQWLVTAYTYRDGSATLGNASTIQLAPGETGTVTIDMEIDLDSGAGPQATYTWNWTAEQQ